VPVARVLVASPSYLQRRGTPADAGALQNHNCLGYAHFPNGPEWHLARKGQVEIVNAKAFCFSCNNGDILAELASLGEGIALLPRFIVDERLKDGALREILGDWHAPEIWLSAIYPPFEKLPAKVALFTKFIEDAVATGVA